jgi:hypothetical protein
VTTTYPSASVVSRALRRDAGIISVAYNRLGYRVRGTRSFAPAIVVACSELPHSRADVFRARELHEHLTNLGWELTPLPEGDTILYVQRVPAKKETKS